MVYRNVNLYRADAVHDGRAQPIYSVSVDEKPGVQALSTTGADLPPVPGKHAGIGRDHEYVRHGSLSIIAALDWHTGEIIAKVELRHRSVLFVALLRRFDQHHPEAAVIRVWCWTTTAHTSPRRPWPTWPVGLAASGMSTHPNMARGSTSWSPRSLRWHEVSFAISALRRWTNCVSESSKASTK